MQHEVATLVKCLGLIAICLMAISLGQQALVHSGIVGTPIWLLDADVERSLPTWFSVVLLALASVSLALVARSHLKSGSRHGLHWALLAAGFLTMSVDEHLELHERIGSSLSSSNYSLGALIYWLPIPLVLAAGIIFWRFLSSLPIGVRNGLVIAGGLYIIGVVAIELVLSTVLGAPSHGTFAGALLVTAEEAFELAGVLLLLLTLTEYLPGKTGTETSVLVEHDEFAATVVDHAPGEPSRAIVRA